MATLNNKVQTTKNKKNIKTNNNLANPKVNESIIDTTKKIANSSDQKSGIKKATLNYKVTAPRSTESKEPKQVEKPSVVSSTLQNNQQVNSNDISKTTNNINNISTELNRNTNNISSNTSLPTKEAANKLEYKSTSTQQQSSSNQQSNINFPINHDYKQNNNAYSQNFVNKNMIVEQKLQHKQSVADTNTGNLSGKTEAIKQDMNLPIPNNSSNKSQNGGLLTSMFNSIKSFLLGSPTSAQNDNTNVRQNTNGNNSESDSLNSHHKTAKTADGNRSNVESTAIKNDQDISKQVSNAKQRIVPHISKEPTATQCNNVNNTQLKSITNLPPRLR